MTRYHCILLAALFACNGLIIRGYSQNKYTLPQITPLSPNAASIGKYGEIPVSLNNGMANISIPLFTIKVGALTIPITVTYHNNGLKNDEIPSWVGHGWDITGFGAVNYQQRGNPDFGNDLGTGMFNPHYTRSSLDSLKKYINVNTPSLHKYNYLEGVIRGDYDTEFDLYNYNFLGNSGSFYFDTLQNIVSVPKSNLKISRIDEGFSIIDEQGNEFLFGAKEFNEMTPSPDETAARKEFDGSASFLLTRIVTSDNRIIQFGYTEYPFSYQTVTDYALVYPTRPFNECPTSSNITSNTNITVKNYLLTSISFDGGSVQFLVSDSTRKDIKALANPNTAFVPYLDKVQLKNDKGQIINNFVLLHSYFNSAARLKLDAIARVSNSDTAEKWVFDYFADNVPSLYFNNTDHWGYFNSNTASSSRIPSADYASMISGWNNPLVSMSNRQSNYTYSRNGMLKTIIYPTGGSTAFEYEPNQVSYRYMHEVRTNPWLGYNVNFSGYTTNTNLVYETTEYNSSIGGSFTLTNATNVSIIGVKQIDPYSFIRSDISISTSPGGTNILQTTPGFTCPSNITNCYSIGEISLNAGTYYYQLTRNLDEESNPTGGYASLQVTMISDTFATPFPYQVGGCRVASIENISITGVKSIKRYKYVDMVDSVIFRNKPNYITEMNVKKNRPVGQGIQLCASCGDEYKIHDQSVVPFVGNPVEYTYVTEYIDDSARNGKTEYVFSHSELLGGDGSFPYITPYMSTWTGGLLLKKKIFKKSGNSFVLVQMDSTTHESSYPDAPFITHGFKAAYWTHCEQEGMDYREIALTNEVYLTERFSLKSSNQTLFDSSGNITSSTENVYGSSNHTLPTTSQAKNSKKKLVREVIKYSFDYDTSNTTTAESQAIKLLIRKNILVPIEKLKIKTIHDTDYVVSGTMFTYKLDKPVVDKISSLKINAPLKYSLFTVSNINGSGTFVKDANYEVKIIEGKYDAYNNILEQERAGDHKTSFIWDYYKNYPIAEITNADSSSVAYTSFESDGTGNWSLVSTVSDSSQSITGRKSYQLSNGNISKTGLSSGVEYVLTYWTKNSSPFGVTGTISIPQILDSTNGWTCFGHRITGVSQVTLSGAGIIDELRLCPSKAQMTTYTYDPLIGVTTQCDTRNKVIYYEYDSFGRLKHIKNHENKILKAFQYSYESSQ